MRGRCVAQLRSICGHDPEFVALHKLSLARQSRSRNLNIQRPGRSHGSMKNWPRSVPRAVISVTFVFPRLSCSFSRTCRSWTEQAAAAIGGLALPGELARARREKEFRRNSMGFQHLAGAAYRALTARKDGPSLYDVCDPELLNPGGGDPHLCKFYRTALGNPVLRPLLRRTGLAELREAPRLEHLRQALIAARDDAAPDWAAIGQPVAALLDTIDLSHPNPKPAPT